MKLTAPVQPRQFDLLAFQGSEVRVAVGTTHVLQAQVVRETEKAVLLKNKSGEAWFAKKALKNGKLAHWVTVEPAQKRMMESCGGCLVPHQPKNLSH